MRSAVLVRDAERRGLVRRERLTSRLLAADHIPVALLVAPSGYGKTTLLAEWNVADQRPFVWLELSDRDNDPAQLLRSIALGIERLTRIDPGIFEALSVPRPSISKVVVSRLLEALRAVAEPFVLVIDDLDAVDEPRSLSAIATLAAHLPSPIQLAIAARSEPPIGAGRLRTQGRLIELHVQDLVMTQSEAAELLEAAGLPLGRGAVKRLVERTEGWPAALYLATLTLEGEADPLAAIERFSGDDRVVADYLRDEFLAKQPGDDLDFLVSTSFLDRLTGPLCDAVLRRGRSGETLRRLSRSNMLLVPLDRKDEQYRYHALMREMLRSELHRLGERREAELHDLASGWYANHGDLDRAITHGISARDPLKAGRLIWSRTAEYESHGREATMRRWLDRFTEEQIASSPHLCVARAANHATRGEGAQCARWTSAAARAMSAALPGEREVLEAVAGVVRAAGASSGEVAQVAVDASRGYELAPDDSLWRALCRFLEGMAHHLTGDRDRARSELEEAARRGTAAPNVQTLALAQLALLALEGGDDAAAASLALQAKAGMDRFGLMDYPTSALVFAATAFALARRGRVEDAMRDAKRSARLLAQLQSFSAWYEAETRIVLGRALLLLDDVPGARVHLQEALRYLRQLPDAIVLEEWVGAASTEADAIGRVGGEWPLTKAELRLLHLLPTHLSFREIAEQLFVSTNTVKTQAQAIYRKLGVSSRGEAVACAEAAGLTRRGDARLPLKSPGAEPARPADRSDGPPGPKRRPRASRPRRSRA